MLYRLDGFAVMAKLRVQGCRINIRHAVHPLELTLAQMTVNHELTLAGNAVQTY